MNLSFLHMIPKKYQFLSGNMLKYIAIITMAIDHFGAVVLYQILIPYSPIPTDSDLYMVYLIFRTCRNIGRAAFPIFCFLLVEGFTHTSSKPRYALRLFLFALISEIP